MAIRTATTIGIIAAFAIMALLIVVTNFFWNNPAPKAEDEDAKIQEFDLELSKQHLSRSADGVLVAESIQVITIQKDGGGTFVATGGKGVSEERNFDVNEEDLRSVMNMVTQTGFMQIPTTDYPANADATNYTKYTLKIQLDEQQKTLQWTDESEVVVPPIIVRMSERIQELAEGQ